MSYDVAYTEWLIEQVQDLYDALDKANRRISKLEKELAFYRQKDELLDNAYMTKQRLIRAENFINDVCLALENYHA